MGILSQRLVHGEAISFVGLLLAHSFYLLRSPSLMRNYKYGSRRHLARIDQLISCLLSSPLRIVSTLSSACGTFDSEMNPHHPLAELVSS